MTVLTVKAQDTATAMEEIVEKLGKDSFIIGTKKIGNEILVKATNSPKKTLHSKQNINKKFNRMISKELNQSSFSSLGNNSHNGIDDKGENFSVNNFGEKALKEFRAEFKGLRDQLNGMVLTDMAGLSPNLKSTVKINLQKIGFSDYTLVKFKDKIENKNTTEGIENFINELADTLTFDDPINSLIDSKYVFVVGFSGSGKTSFSAKIAATIAQDIKNSNIALGKLGKQNEFLNDNLKSYSRLINVPNLNILPENAQKKLESIEKKLIIDVSADIADTLNIVKSVREKVGSNKVLTIVVIPSGSSRHYLKKLLEFYGSIDPIVAFTKLDENNISAEELSVIAEKKCSVGYLTDTRSILKSINFTNKEILAQYLKDNIINFCK